MYPDGQSYQPSSSPSMMATSFTPMGGNQMSQNQMQNVPRHFYMGSTNYKAGNQNSYKSSFGQ